MLGITYRGFWVRAYQIGIPRLDITVSGHSPVDMVGALSLARTRIDQHRDRVESSFDLNRGHPGLTLAARLQAIADSLNLRDDQRDLFARKMRAQADYSDGE